MKLVAAVSVTQANRATSAQVHAQRHYITRVDTVSRIPGAMVIGDAGAILVSANAVSQANAVSGALVAQPSVTQVHASAVSQSNSATSAAIKQTHKITSANVAQSNAASGVSVAGVGGVSPANSTQANVTSGVAIKQTHKIGAANAAQSNYASSVSLAGAAVAGNSMRVDVGSLISGAMVVGDAGHGVLGSAVPSSGDDGPGYLYDFLTLPGDAGSEVRGLVTTWPAHGSLFPYEDTSFVYTPNPGFVGTDSFSYQAYINGIPVGSPNTVDITIAAEPHRVSFASATQHNAASSASLLRESLVVPASASQANSASAAFIRQHHYVTGANAAQLNTVSSGLVGIPTSLVVASPVAIDNIASASAIVQTHLVLAANVSVLNAASSGAYTEAAASLSAVDIQRLSEIWARMELDPANPLSVSTTQLTVGTIMQAISANGATRTGALLGISEDASTMILEIWQRLGLDPANPLVQTATTLDAGGVHCAISETAGVVTVARQ